MLKGSNSAKLPVSLTSFVGRIAELADLRKLVAEHRMVTLTGTGGVGKTRLAQQLAREVAVRFDGGSWWVDLASITDPHLVADRVADALGLPEQPDLPVLQRLCGFLADRRALLVLDNCEQLLGGCTCFTALVATLLAECPELRIVATSREAVGVPGEVRWQTPTLTPADDAVELFIQRAQLVRPAFTGAGDDAALVAEICTRLDGLPLAIELAATRVRALSLAEIADGLSAGLHLLTGVVRTAESRQQTLRASVDWSHNLLSTAEQVILRRLGVFLGGFDLAAAGKVAGDGAPGSQIIDMLTQLVDKSLLTAANTGCTTRYRMLETVRHYALEKLDEADETDLIRTRHRDHYTALFDRRREAGYRWNLEQAEGEIDNLRAALTWSRDRAEFESVAVLASALLPLWTHGRTGEGLTWLDCVGASGTAVAPATRASTLADQVILGGLAGDLSRLDQAEEALAVARDLDDPRLLAWTLTACGFTHCYTPELSTPYFREAITLAPAVDDDWLLSQMHSVHAYSAYLAGDLETVLAAAEMGRVLGSSVGDSSVDRQCRYFTGLAYLMQGNLAETALYGEQLVAASRAAYDPLLTGKGTLLTSEAWARQGKIGPARAAATEGVTATADFNAFHRATNLGALVDVALAAGDIASALTAAEAASTSCPAPQLWAINSNPLARAALAGGNVAAARRWIDETLPVASGAHRMVLLDIAVRVAIAEGAVDRAERDARTALRIAAETGARMGLSDVIECLAALAIDPGRNEDAAMLFGAAAGIRERTGAVRFKIYDADHFAAVDRLREAIGPDEFDSGWSRGAALSTAEAISHALRDGRKRDRPSQGWAALTQAELNVARLVGEGLRTKDIGTKLFISPRTVDSHLGRIYTKLGVSSRVQLAQEAARNA